MTTGSIHSPPSGSGSVISNASLRSPALQVRRRRPVVGQHFGVVGETSGHQRALDLGRWKEAVVEDVVAEEKIEEKISGFNRDSLSFTGEIERLTKIIAEQHRSEVCVILSFGSHSDKEVTMSQVKLLQN